MRKGTARNAFPQMVSDDESASGGETLLMKSRQQSPNVGAATDRLQSAGRSFLAIGSLQLLPNALGGGGEQLGVGYFAAKLGDCLFEVRVFFRTKEVHDAPFRNPWRPFFNRARAR